MAPTAHCDISYSASSSISLSASNCFSCVRCFRRISADPATAFSPTYFSATVCCSSSTSMCT
eukprot:scaffold2437_cov111-Isochrysis_galbana.AAC.2